MDEITTGQMARLLGQAFRATYTGTEKQDEFYSWLLDAAQVLNRQGNHTRAHQLVLLANDIEHDTHWRDSL